MHRYRSYGLFRSLVGRSPNGSGPARWVRMGSLQSFAIKPAFIFKRETPHLDSVIFYINLRFLVILRNSADETPLLQCGPYRIESLPHHARSGYPWRSHPKRWDYPLPNRDTDRARLSVGHFRDGQPETKTRFAAEKD